MHERYTRQSLVEGIGPAKVTQLKAAFEEALGIDQARTNWDQLTYRGIPEWDSVAHMQLVVAIETAFGIMLDTDEVVGMSSYPIARRILHDNHGLDFDA